ncbi:MAG: hypothetical protein OXC08_18820 [Thiotrichales bacterium]|nr:hypothetical protein [Thiotrichales bacterium]
MLAVTLLLLASLVAGYCLGMVLAMLTWKLEGFFVGGLVGFLLMWFGGGWLFDV